MKKNYLLSKIVLFAFFVVLFSGCEEKKKVPVPVKTLQEMKELQEPLVKVNRYFVEKDYILIDKYTKRMNLDMQTTETGLWYKIIEEGKGDTIGFGSQVTIDYDITMLDGTKCYSTDSLGPESFLVGLDQVESGLNEGIRLLKSGAKAKFIMPPHLAHGLLGDDDKIPPRAILIFDIEVLLAD